MVIGKKTVLLLLAYCHFVNSDPAFSSFESQPDPDQLVSLLNRQYQEADIIPKPVNLWMLSIGSYHKI